ncbi:MAG TPA: Asp23/Gls24 family envelope stress response protein [Candidatus Galloscillospira stercoripullorum]|nr:Asp23/Gls24 family envelope stress response protein [Candidatus Galloscillospira stercoripullorum]
MSESKDYISRSDELGNIHISEDVLAVIAAAAALEVEGVGSLSANLGTDLVEMLGGKKNLSKGVRLSVEDGNITVDLSIMVKYGYVVPEVAKQVQDGVHTAIENMSGLTPACVNVHVAGVTFEKESRHA